MKNKETTTMLENSDYILTSLKHINSCTRNILSKKDPSKEVLISTLEECENYLSRYKNSINSQILFEVVTLNRNIEELKAKL